MFVYCICIMIYDENEYVKKFKYFRLFFQSLFLGPFLKENFVLKYNTINSMDIVKRTKKLKCSR